MSDREDRKVRALMAACRRIQDKRGDLVMKIPVDATIHLIAVMQLALSHPDLPPDMAQATRKLCTRMISLLERDEPLIGPIMRKGFGRPEEGEKERGR